MPVAQFLGSLGRIWRAHHVNRPLATIRHIGWQVRKVLGGFPVTLRISRSLICDDSSAGVMPLVNALGRYDFNNMSLFVECLCDGGTFFDVGANIGPYTLLLSENEKVGVTAFEPNPTAFKKLKANVQLNHRSNVELVNVALSCQAGEVRMTNDGSSALNKVVASTEHRGIAVSSERFQKFLENPEKPHPMIAKIDVEGHEAQVIAGAGSALDLLQLIALEELPGADFSSLMRARGFDGPFYADAKSRRLSRTRPPYSEDCIFLSGGGSLATSCGWHME